MNYHTEEGWPGYSRLSFEGLLAILANKVDVGVFWAFSALCSEGLSLYVI